MVASLRLAASLTLAATFGLSGLGKLRSGRFVADLADYRILPLRAVIPVATLVPFLEFGLAILLLAWPTSAVPVYLAAAMLAAFAAAMALNLIRGRSIACGCRGSDKPISWDLVAWNLTVGGLGCIIASYHPALGGLSPLETIATMGYVIVGSLAMRLSQQLRQLRSAARMLGLGTGLGPRLGRRLDANGTVLS